jgi:hypothetical protein
MGSKCGVSGAACTPCKLGLDLARRTGTTIYAPLGCPGPRSVLTDAQEGITVLLTALVFRAQRWPGTEIPVVRHLS